MHNLQQSRAYSYGVMHSFKKICDIYNKMLYGQPFVSFLERINSTSYEVNKVIERFTDY